MISIIWMPRRPNSKVMVAVRKQTVSSGPGLFGSALDPNRGPERLALLRDRALSCTSCKLAKTRTQVVFGRGKWESPAVAFVGDSPSASDDRSGRAYSGNAGTQLDRMVEAARLDPLDIYYCHAICCMTPESRKPKKIEIVSCGDFLRGQLRAIRPLVVVTLGEVAAQAVLRSTRKLPELRGKWTIWEGMEIMPTHHPVQLLRARDSRDGLEIRKQAWHDFQAVTDKISVLKQRLEKQEARDA